MEMASEPISGIPLILLAGGRATRLKHLSNNVPKFLMPTRQGLSFADVQFGWIRAQGFRKVYVSVGYLGEKVVEYCGDGRKYGLDIQYFFDGDSPLGTGGAVRRIVEATGCDLFFVLYGDTILQLDAREVLVTFARSGFEGTMTVLRNPPAGHRPNADLQSSGLRYSKTSPQTSWSHIDYGFLILRRSALLGFPRSGAYDLAEDLEALSMRGRIGGVEVSEAFNEIGDPEALELFQRRFKRGLIVLDRDGVINRMLLNGVTGEIDSPMNADQVELVPGVLESLRRAQSLGYSFVIATNQPAAAKRKTTRKDLEAVHSKILKMLGEGGVIIHKSYICWHRREDACECRKPKPGLIRKALIDHPMCNFFKSWMVGDRIVDLEAGRSAGLSVAYLAPQSYESKRNLEEKGIEPDFHGENMSAFVTLLERTE
jgi:D-glycero-D-manno-heptose 1,7-bisphosphate phosphatase